MLDILFLSLLGIFIGTVCGIVPGFHVNTIIPILFLISSFLNLNPHQLMILIISTAISEIFFNFIPSIFIGAPEEGTAFSVLPGHKLLMEGKGYEAIKLVVIGGIGSLISSIILIFLFFPYFPIFYKITRPYLHFILLAIVFFMILSEKKLEKILFAAIIFSLSGIFGLIVLNSQLISKQQVLFPVFTGMFGISTLLVSISERSSLPEQDYSSEIKISKEEMIKSIILGAISGILVGYLPGIGISEAAAISQYLTNCKDARNFLIVVSGINVGNEIFSLISLYLLNNPRSGASVAIQSVLGEMSFYDTVISIGVICFVSGIAALLTLKFGKTIPKLLVKLDYKTLTLSVITFISSMVFVFTNFVGFFILLVSTSIGIFCIYLGIRRSHCMGVLLLPTIIFFSGINADILSILGI